MTPGAGRGGRHRARKLAAGLLVGILASGLAACGAGGGTATPSATPTVDQLVSLGDSYAVGFRPLPGGGNQTSEDNFPNAVGRQLTTPAREVRVANFGCAGAKLTDLVATRGCDDGLRAPGSPHYVDVSQLDAALAYLQSNQGRIAAVTMVIGGNDLNGCFELSGGRLTNSPSACVNTALADLRDQLTGVLQQIRAAAGPDVPIVGVGYPDIYLALYREGGDGQALAKLSVDLFTEDFNPVLRDAYASVGGQFVDLTAAFRGTEPLTSTATVPGYGRLPVAVGAICTLTYMCSDQDQHPNSAGQQRIAAAVLAEITAQRATSTGTGTARPTSPG